MTVIRCPKCGRAADGVECFACGHAWGRDPAFAAEPSPPPATRTPQAPAAVPAGSSENPFTVSGATNPFARALGTETPQATSSWTNPFGSHAPAATSSISEDPGGAAEPPRDAPTELPVPASPTAEGGERVEPFATAVPPPDPLSRDGDTPPKPAAAGGAVNLEGDSFRELQGDDEPLLEPTLEVPRPLDEDAAEQTVPDRGPRLASGGLGLALGRFTRSPRAYAASAGASFVLVFTLGAVGLKATKDETLSRIDGGEARAVIVELKDVARSGREHLLLGHAYARIGETDQALRCYHDAVRADVSDERALAYAVEALHKPLQEYPKAVLADWTPDARGPLREAALKHPWTHRHNALEVLEQRGEADDRLRQAVARRDLLDPERNCDDHKGGLMRLAQHGRGEAALAAIAEVRERVMESGYSCLAADLDAAAAIVRGDDI